MDRGWARMARIVKYRNFGAVSPVYIIFCLARGPLTTVTLCTIDARSVNHSQGIGLSYVSVGFKSLSCRSMHLDECTALSRDQVAQNLSLVKNHLLLPFAYLSSNDFLIAFLASDLCVGSLKVSPVTEPFRFSSSSMYRVGRRWA